MTDKPLPIGLSKEIGLVYIEWRDSLIVRDQRNWIPVGWMKDLAKDGYAMHYTSGFLIDETDDYYLVSHSVRANGVAMDAIAIPKCSVVLVNKASDLMVKGDSDDR